MRVLRPDLRPATRVGECSRRTDAYCSRWSSFPLADSPGYGGTDCRSVGAFAYRHGNVDPRLAECRGNHGSARSVPPWSFHARWRPRERFARRLRPHRDDRARSGFGRRFGARARKQILPCAVCGNPSSPARRAPTVRASSRRLEVRFCRQRREAGPRTLPVAGVRSWVPGRSPFRSATRATRLSPAGRTIGGYRIGIEARTSAPTGHAWAPRRDAGPQLCFAPQHPITVVAAGSEGGEVSGFTQTVSEQLEWSSRSAVRSHARLPSVFPDSDSDSMPEDCGAGLSPGRTADRRAHPPHPWPSLHGQAQVLEE